METPLDVVQSCPIFHPTLKYRFGIELNRQPTSLPDLIKALLAGQTVEMIKDSTALHQTILTAAEGSSTAAAPTPEIAIPGRNVSSGFTPEPSEQGKK